MDITIKMMGISPLLQHNVRLADPLDEASKAVAAATAALKRDKTEATAVEKSRVEWLGGMYFSPSLGVYIPASWISGSLIRGGVVYGRKGTAVKQALILNEYEVPVVHDGPSLQEQMWADAAYRDVRAVRVGKAVVMRTRPRFPQWAVMVSAFLDETTLDFDVLRAIAERAGQLVGMGDYRPEKGGVFGRYTATVEKI